MSTPGSEGHTQRGFTLFELLVVLVLVSAAVAVVAPSFSRSLRGLELEAATRNLIIRMRQARSQAIGAQQVFRIILVQSEGQLPEEDPEGDYYVVADEYERVMETIFLPYDGVVEIPPDSYSPLRVDFYPNGRSSGGLFALSNERRKIVVWVDPITGFAKSFETEEQLRNVGIQAF